MVIERYFQNNYWDNLGLSLSAGTLTVNGSNGNSLAPSNPSVIFLPSKANPGQHVRYVLTANQSFDDASAGGGSDITGNLFGFVTSVAITVDVPFFLYAVSNDAEDTITFMLSRVPGMTVSPTSTEIGTPASAIADEQFSFFAFSSVTVTEYDGNPCVCLGSFRMRMSASDDWTVQALVGTDGIGQYQESVTFTQPLGQFNADSGTVTISGTSTAAVFSSVTAQYHVTRDGNCYYEVSLSGDGGTDGSGTDAAALSIPFKPQGPRFQVSGLSLRNAGNFRAVNYQLDSTNNEIAIYEDNTGAGVLTWASFGAGNRFMRVTPFYPIGKD